MEFDHTRQKRAKFTRQDKICNGKRSKRQPDAVKRNSHPERYCAIIRHPQKGEGFTHAREYQNCIG